MEEKFQVIDLLGTGENKFASNLRANVDRFRSEMGRLGFKVMGDPRHPICPVFLGDARYIAVFGASSNIQ